MLLVWTIFALAAFVFFFNAFLSHEANNEVNTIIQYRSAVANTSSIAKSLSVTSAPPQTDRETETDTETRRERHEAKSELINNLSKPSLANADRNAQQGFSLDGLRPCAPEVQSRLDRPALSPEEVRWCRHALDPLGGAVQVGRSWGNLKTRKERDAFDRLDCNSVSTGRNPSCTDAWGDAHVHNWRGNIAHSFVCPVHSGGRSNQSSSVRCHKNEINDLFCALSHAKIDFSKYRSIPGSAGIASRAFDPDFLSVDCDGAQQIPGFKFNHLFSTKSSPGACDEYIAGTTLLYSHDNLRNLAHTCNDVMNVWLMLWLEGLAGESRESVNLLTVDAMKQYNNFDDLVNAFFFPYKLQFKQIMRGLDFEKRTVCFEKLLLQPLPSRGFVWENWHQDLPCSFVGPSSLFQRWNVHMRKNMNILAPQHTPASDVPQVLLIVRSDKKNDWGSYRTSRLFRNEEEIVRALKTLSADGERFQLVVRDLARMPDFEEQVRLLANTSLVVAMHGAGMVQSMYMPIGTKNCCGVLELFPHGEFTPVHGFGNMFRKLGLHYDRLDISPGNSHAEGAHVPTAELVDKVKGLLRNISAVPSCILPIVRDDPYLTRSRPK